MNTENTLNSELKSLSKKIRQYRSGEGVPDTPCYLTGMKDRLEYGAEGLIFKKRLDYKAAYKDAWDQALNIMQKFTDTDFTGLPGNESEPMIGLRYLEEWCYTNGQRVADEHLKPPAKTGQEKKAGEIEKPSYSRSQSIQELIARGENHTLEFKETFQYNTKNKEIDKSVRHDALKTIAGFLNADGGTLLIGISDSGKVKGIDIDKKAMNRANNDKFELDVRNHIAGKNSKFKPSAIGSVKFKFEELQSHTICIIDVQPLPKSEILHFDDGVYVRDGNNTLKLTGNDLTSWIKQRELEGKTTPKTPKADESTQNGVTTQDIEELLELFRQLENLSNPALPTKDDSLWREAKKEAQKELSDQLRERSSTFSERPGLYVPPRKATKAEQRKVQEQIENRIALIAEKKYREKDQAYLEAVDAAKKTTADVLKRIDHLLECFGGALQRFRRTKDTWLVEDFKKIRKLYDCMDKDQIKYSLRETIDALEALKLKLERHLTPDRPEKGKQKMALTDDERKSLLLYTDNLYRWTEKLKKPCRVIVALLTGVLPPNEIESLFKSIGLQNSFAGQQLLNDYQELIEAAKAAEKEFSDTTGQTTDQFQTMKYRAFSLANFMKQASSKAEDTTEPNKPQKPTGASAGQLINYINAVLDDIQQLKACRSRNPHVSKKIRIELAVAYHETKKCVEKIRAGRPEIKDAPAESDDPEKYLRSAHMWCVGQLFWENGEQIGAEKTADKPADESAETEQNIAPAKRWNIWTWLKGVIKEAYRIAMRSFFDSAMHK